MRAALGAIGYRKPGAVLLTLRDNVVGRETIDRAFREYVHRWAFKHPTPGDFFRTIENVSGQDLVVVLARVLLLRPTCSTSGSTAWRTMRTAADRERGSERDGPGDPDDRQLGGAGGGWRGGWAPADPRDRTAVIYLRRNTSIVFPVTLRLKLSDDTTQDVSLPVDIWARSTEFAATVAVKAAVVGARLWPERFVPDWNSSNDTWGTPLRAQARQDPRRQAGSAAWLGIRSPNGRNGRPGTGRAEGRARRSGGI